MKIILLTNQFPTEDNTEGIFNYSRIKELENKNHKVLVVQPLSLAPTAIQILPLPKLGVIISDIKKKIAISRLKISRGIDITYPLWFSPPRKIFWNHTVHFLRIFAGRKIAREIKKFDPDLIVTSEMNPYAFYSKQLKSITTVPIFSIFEGSDVLIQAHQYDISKSMLRIIETSCDRVILVSTHMSEFVKHNFKLKNTLTIKNGYDNKIFYYTRVGDSTRTRKQIISIGRLHPVKGYDLLLEAMISLKDYDLIIIGDGKMKRSYLEYIQNNDLEDRVTFVGSIQPERLRKFLSEADIYCLPSRSEGLPATPLEAMACGLPVVVTNVGGMPEFIEEGFNGFMCEAENVESLSETIQKAGKTKWNHQAISNWVNNNFSWENWVDQLIVAWKDYHETQE